MANIFVSYSSKDADKIRPLVEELEQAGLSVWWDRFIESGTEFDRVIEKALDQAECIVAIWSVHSVDSDWVRTEASEGMDRKVLVPIKIDDVKPPLAFRRLQTTDLVGYPNHRNELELKRMLNSIYLILNVSPSIAATPQSSGLSRRRLTILRARIDGLSASSDLDLEDIEDTLGKIRQESRREVEAFGGVVHHFSGTEMVAIFGFPLTHEDDPARAIDVAIKLKETITASKSFAKLGLKFSSGISSGLSIVKQDDTVKDRFEVTGVCVDRSVHLLALAANCILVCRDTLRRVEDFYNVNAVEPFAVASEMTPIYAYAIGGRTTIRTRMEVQEIRGLTPFAGRDNEISLLCQSRMSSTQSGRVVSVIGEAGSGKSRLVREFCHSLTEDIVILQGRCLASGQHITYLPIINLLQRELGLNDIKAIDRHDFLVREIQNLDESCGAYIPHYLHLLSIATDEYELPDSLQGDAMRYALQEALVAVTIALTNRGPSVLILEDWHWADEASDTVVNQLVEISAANNFLLLVLHRPEYQPDWHHHANYQQLKLLPLFREAANALVVHKLGARFVPLPLSNKIFEVTDGNPFFIEEICTSLLEEGNLHIENQKVILKKPVAELNLPASVEAVIHTRLDKLDNASRAVLSIASVIGKEFDYQTLDHVSQHSETLELILGELTRAGLIARVRSGHDRAYMFKHVLTQVVTYESMLKKQRRYLHAQVANSLEIIYADQRQEFVELLAFHYSKTDDKEKGVSYSIQAGVKASRSSASHAAINHYTVALEILESLQDDEPNKRQRRDVNLSLSQQLLVAHGYSAPEVFLTFDKARDLSRELGDSRALFPNLWGLWRYYYNIADFDAALSCSKKMEDIAIHLADQRLLSIASTSKAVTLCWVGRLPEARQCFESGQAVYDLDIEASEADIYGVLPHVMNLAFYPMALTALGLVETSLAMIEKLRDVTAKIEHKPTIVLSLLYQATALSTLGFYKESMQGFQHVVELADKEGFPHWSALTRYNITRMQFRVDDVDKSMAEIQARHDDVRKYGVALVTPTYHMAMAKGYSVKGAIDEGIDHLNSAIGKVPLFDAELYRFRGDLQRSTNLQAALSDYRKALEIAERFGMLASQLRTVLELVKIEQKQGASDTELQRLLQIYNRVIEGRNSPTMLAAEKVLLQGGLEF